MFCLGFTDVIAKGFVREADNTGGEADSLFRDPTDAPEEGDDLGAGTALVGAECRFRGSRCDVVLHGPKHGRCVPGIAGHVSERHFCLRRNGAAGCTPEEGYCLRTGTASVGTEQRLRDTAGDSVLHCPAHCVVVICGLPHVGEGQRFNRRGRASGCAPEEGDDLGAGAWGVRGEHIWRSSVGDVVCRGPVYCVVIICTWRNVVEG